MSFDVEDRYFLGIQLDRYVHFILIFLVAYLLVRRGWNRTAFFVSIVLVVLKEMVDFIPLIFHGKIFLHQYVDSGLDIFVGVLGYYAAVWLRRWLQNRKS